MAHFILFELLPATRTLLGVLQKLIELKNIQHKCELLRELH